MSNLKVSSTKLRIMTYNILADQYAQEHSQDLYSSVPCAAIEWGSRAVLIAKEVAHWSPDVVCFQEVDHFKHLQGLLRPHGYKGIFTQRTGDRPDGLAMFWKRSAFSMESAHSVEFAPLGLKDNVCQLTVLKSKNKDSDAAALLIANIHVLFNPKRGDIKLAQVRTMLERAQSLVSNRPGGACPIIVCGDFNSAVGSPLYDFVLQGELELGATERRRVSGQVEVAGRSGWPSIRADFLDALLHSGGGGDNITSEVDAMAIAVGVLPRYNSVTDPHNSLREPRLLVLDRDDVATESAVQQCGHEMGGSITEKAMRPWSYDELKLAAGHRDDVAAGVARHPLQLQSAYLTVAGCEPLYTTVHDKYVGTVDYIFFTSSTTGVEMNVDGDGESEDTAAVVVQRLRPVRVLQPPPLRTMHSGLPSLAWPSDHLCLMADFEVIAAVETHSRGSSSSSSSSS